MTPLGKSDHNALTFKFNCYLDYSKPQERFVYDKANFDDMRKNLAEEKRCDNFIASVNVMSIEQIWDSIKTKIISLRDNFVPKKSNSSRPDWKGVAGIPIDSDVKKEIKEKHASHRH